MQARNPCSLAYPSVLTISQMWLKLASMSS